MKKIQKNRNPEEILEERIEKIQKSREWRHSFWEIVVIAVVLYGLFAHVIGFSWNQGDAMAPTLQEEELLLFYRLDPMYHRGDVIVFDTDTQENAVRRVIAVAGDVIDIDKETGALVINEEPIEESYVYTETILPKEAVEFPCAVKSGQVFVMGDHRENTEDSREFGCVDVADISGRVLFHLGQMY